MIDAPLVQKSYPGLKQKFNWYDIKKTELPDTIDMLFVDGPHQHVNKIARYPAGPELFARLSNNAHIFLDDAARDDEKTAIKFWQEMLTDYSVRELQVEKGAVELYRLNNKNHEN